MKITKITIVTTSLLSLIIFYLGFTFSGDLIEYFLPKVGRVSYQVVGITGGFKQALFLSVVFALLPISVVLVWRIAPVVSVGKRILVALTTIVFMILALIMRRQMLTIQFKSLLKFLPVDSGGISFPFDAVNFELYLICGLITGCVVSFFLFREKYKQ